MRLSAIFTLIPLLAPAACALAQGGAPDHSTGKDWSGSGELGFAVESGNSRTENLNAKLDLSRESKRWKNSFSLSGLRSKGEVTLTDADGNTLTGFSTTANRYQLAASLDYKFNPRDYLVAALRYDHDDFGSNLWQGSASIGYGHIVIENAGADLSFEIGPGYKRYRAANATVSVNARTLTVTQPMQAETVLRSLIDGKLSLTANTQLEDTLLVEAGWQNTYMQNDAGLSVSMTEKLALKLALQARYNSRMHHGAKHTDKLLTTNLVYNF